jgi:glucose-6-phosphate 1-dehydrogenase
VQPLLEVWQQGTPEDYEAGSAGPESADALMHRAHRRWHKLG